MGRLQVFSAEVLTHFYRKIKLVIVSVNKSIKRVVTVTTVTERGLTPHS